MVAIRYNSGTLCLALPLLAALAGATPAAGQAGPTERSSADAGSTQAAPAVAVDAATVDAATVDRAAADRAAGQVELRIQPDEVEAVLEILELRSRGEPVPERAWDRLYATEGYARMMARERSMDERLGLQRGFTDEHNRSFLAADTVLLANLAALREALDVWKRVDVERAGRRALAYLPRGTRIHATIYPLLRAETNSFVFELGSDNPAIFMYMEPGQTPATLENTLAHELHHIGVAQGCPRHPDVDDPRAIALYDWTGAFAEGMAVLAAAGSPDADTHPDSPAALRRAWAIRQDSVAEDMAALSDFFTAIHDGTLTGKALTRAGFGFINREGFPQGAFYTVGWFMASTVERELGHDAVTELGCNGADLMATYNRAAARINARRAADGSPEQRRLPVWPAQVLVAIGRF